MFNKLTHKLMDDTFKKSKDGKGYILDIRRPALIRNTTTYEQNEKATFNNINVRTGLGNTVLRRVNFIKGIIQPRTSMTGRSTQQTPMKTLQDMIKEGIKIKYEEPDPWDSAWIDAKNKIVTRMKTAGATEIEISQYLITYPPLNRAQRTRPVTRNPLEDANLSIKDQISTIGTNVDNVNKSVINSTTEINKNATALLTYNGARDLWLQTQLGQLDQLLYNGNQDTIAGRNILGAKLQQISQQLTTQNLLQQKQIMIGIEALKIDVALIPPLTINEIKDSSFNIAVLALLKHYNVDLLGNTPTLFEYTTAAGAVENITWSQALSYMVLNPETQLLQDVPNKKLYFMEGLQTSISLTQDEQTSAFSNLARIGYEDTVTDENATNVETKKPEQVIPDTFVDIKEDDIDRQANIQKIIDILQNGIEYVAATYYKVAYEKNIKNKSVGFTDRHKRILKIDINYQYKKNDTTGEYVQSNSNFLNITLFGGPASNQYKTNKLLYGYTYEKTENTNYVYFVTSSVFGAKDANGTSWDNLVGYIETAIDADIKQIAIDAQIRDTTKEATALAESTRIATEQKDKEDRIKAIEASYQDSLVKAAAMKARKSETNMKIIELGLEKEKKANDAKLAKIEKDKDEAEKANNAKLAKIEKDRDEAEKQSKLNDAKEEIIINRIKTGLENIKKDKVSMFGSLLRDGQADITNDTHIIILKPTGNNMFKLVLNSTIDNYNVSDSKYGLYGNITILDVQASAGDDDNTYYSILMNIDYNYSNNYIFLGSDFVDELNTHLPTMGNGKNKIRTYSKTMSGKGKKENPWLIHVKKFRASNPTLKYSDVLKKAKATYKK